MKKGDKIVIVVGVVVLVIAAIGLWIYAYQQHPKEEKPEEKIKSFDVVWEEKKGSLPTIEDFATAKKLFRKGEPYNKSVSIPVSNIKDITFTLTWEDDHTYGILKRKGEDTLTFSVKDPDGKEVGSAESIGNGTIVLTAENPEPPLMVSSIEAKSLEEAMEILENNYTSNKWKDEPFELNVSVKIGEKIFRPLQFLRDKGNNFTIDVTYTYYEPTVLPAEESNSTYTSNVSMSESQMSESQALSMILETGCARAI